MNQMIEASNQYAEVNHSYAKFSNEITNLFQEDYSELESIGIEMTQDHKIKLNHSLMIDAMKNGDLQKVFQEGKIGSLLVNKLDQVVKDPIQYLEKKIVMYPNYSSQGVGYTYLTSMYSGMIFNSYC